jgi:hypothetical protein
MKPPGTWGLTRALREPATTSTLSPEAWGALLRQARACGLLGRLAHRVEQACAAAGWTPPEPVQAHFASSARLERAQHAEILREAAHLQRALAPLGDKVVVLKGAAYVLAGLPAASGRLFSDIDIMVPKHCIAHAESLLMQHGWLGSHHDAYDQRYYREWMHELPPMTHVHRQTVLDVHHTVLPETARLHPDAAALFEDARPLASHAGMWTLSPEDMVLHSMAHLFMNEELSHALRDLSDIDLLLRQAVHAPGFWQRLADRARRHQLGRILHHGLRYARLVFDSPSPPDVGGAQRAAISGDAPGPAQLAVLDALWLRALAPPENCVGLPRQAAEVALYVRGHWLRMPPLMLARHLATKALRARQPTGEAAAAAP